MTTKDENETRIGHNSQLSGGEATMLRGLIEEIERLDEQRRELSEQRSEIMRTAKDDGFDMGALREVLRLRRMQASERADRAHAVDVYLHALGMLADLPLGRAALERAGLEPASS